LPLKQNNLVVILACGWLCAPVPIYLLGGHKSWHNRDVALTLVRHTGTRSSRPSGFLSRLAFLPFEIALLHRDRSQDRRIQTRIRREDEFLSVRGG